MKKTGASLVVHALEEIGVQFTFGIPGVHNTELYDELNKSDKIQPFLVTHEGGAAFMADGVSRTGKSIGTLAIVPAAGMTHAMSGIGEAFLDGIPMLVISGGIRRDDERQFKLHQLDQQKILEGITKKAYLIKDHTEIIPTIYEAYNIATRGVPGPVFIEVPVDVQLFKGEFESLAKYPGPAAPPGPDTAAVKMAAEMLRSSRRPGLFLGWGCKESQDLAIELAELLESPVSTTLQGLSVFPSNHPLSVGMGFGGYSVPAGEAAFKDCDCLLAIGASFGEIPTGSYGMVVPENLIHGDISADVFDKNYPAKIRLQGDAREIMSALLAELKGDPITNDNKTAGVRDIIKKNKESYLKEWLAADKKDRVNPARFFQGLRSALADDDLLVVDDGNHTFLAEELFPVHSSKGFISPTDFNCMGYAVPAAIGASLANPGKKVAAIVGDGAFLMTCMEILTATTLNQGVVYFVFSDGELSQISQGQEIPYNRKTCTVLGNIKVEGVATATGAAFVPINTNDEIKGAIDQAFAMAAKGQPVIVDVKIDYSKRTRFTEGVVKTTLSRFPLGTKFRFIGRALTRKITG